MIKEQHEYKEETFWEGVKYLFSSESIKILLNGGWDNKC